MKKLILMLAVLAVLPAVANAKKKPRASRSAQTEVAAPAPFPEAKFVRDSATIKGTIVDYNPNFMFRTGEMGLHNPFTAEQTPMVFMIADDGTFEAKFPVWFPVKASMDLGGKWFTFYVEPGKTLEVSFFNANPLFSGDLAQENTQIAAFERTSSEWPQRKAAYDDNDWKATETLFRGVMNENMRRLDESLAAGAISEKVYNLLRNREWEEFAEAMLSRYMYRDDRGADQPEEYYTSFMREVPFDNPAFLAFADWVIPNRLEYMPPMRNFVDRYTAMSPGSYLESKGVDLTDEEIKSLMTWRVVGEETSAGKERRLRMADSLRAKYADPMVDYEKYLQTIPPYPDGDERLRIGFAHADSVWQSLTGRAPGIMMDIVTMNSLQDITRQAAHLTPADIVQMHRAVYDNVEHPFLRDEVWSHYEGMLPRMGNQAVEIPEGPAKDILLGILGKFAGKPVLVDFWGTACGPCVAAIKGNGEVRAQIEEKGDMALVFLSSPSWSPRLAEYEKFVTDNAMTNHVRLTQDEWNIVVAQFGISSVPRYILFDGQGRLLDEHHSGFLNEFLTE